jgi:gliding motility-associated-like protein
MKALLLKSAFCLFFVVGILHFTCAQSISSDFSASADGWTIYNTSTGSSIGATYLSTGGNPGGYISDGGTSGGGTMLYAEAPAKFHGDFSKAYKQNLTFDLNTSSPGTDNNSGDVIISGNGGILVYQLTAKPGTSFTSYSVPLDETVTGWHFGGVTGAAPNQTQMKMVLSNITSLRIRTKYTTSNTFTVTGSVDNAILNVPILANPPIISSILPVSALAGTSIVINGLNFNPTPSQNVVYFNGIKGNVTNASATQIQVTVPTSAAYGPITVVNLSTNLKGASVQSFNPLFDNNKDFGGQIIPASLNRGYDVILPMSSSASNGFGRMDKGDLDGDGRIDLVTTETSTTKIYAFQNLGSSGAVAISSFGSAIALPSLSTIPGGSPSLSEVLIVDVDNDGKLDVAASTSSNYSAGTGFLAIFKNTSTVGSISFASPLFFAYNYYSALYMAGGDLDGDGRTDFAFTTGTAPGNIFISQNLSTPGNIDFSFGGNIGNTSTSGLSDIVIGDLTGDGKPEIVCPGYNAATLSIYQNNSSPGSISMGAAFTVPAIVSYTNQLVMTDFDADNKLDMAWSTYGAQYVYFTKNNYSGGTFDASSFGSTIQIASTLSEPLGITAGDINGDNKPEVMVSGYSDLAVLQNVGTNGNLNSNSFLPATLFQGSSSASSIFGLSPVVADLDGDNKSEVIFVSSAGGLPAGATGIYIFHNESYPAPLISGVSPTSASVGANVSLNGNFMFTGNVPSSIRLNKSLSTISGSPSNTLTTIINPTGGISGKFTVTNHGLMASSSYFRKIFPTNGVINASSFGPSIDFALASSTSDVLELADFDDDGKTDVVVMDNSFTTKIFKNTSSANQAINSASLSLQGTTYSAGYNVIALDIDGDGKVDLNNGFGLLQNNSTSGSISFLGGPNGAYTYSGGFNRAASADFNKDGKIDLAVINGTVNIQVYENRSSKGVFENNANLSTYSTNAVNLTRPANYGGVVADDFDGDGYEDLISANQNTSNLTYYLNTKQYGRIAASSFSFLGDYSTSGSQPTGVTANDFDGDGKTDIAISYYNSALISVYRNISSAGSISFASPVDITAANKGYNITSQDLDGDGLAEIVVIHRPNPGPGSFSVFQNKSTSGNVSFNTAVNYSLASPGHNPQALGIADINLDQKPDILIVGDPYPTGTNALMVFENKIVTPSITVTSQPISIYSVCDGATPVISTAATGTTNISYQWQIYNSGTSAYIDLTNTGGYSNVSTSSLTINSTGNFGAGTYRCKISGDFAATVYTNLVSFSVNPIPAAPTTTDVNNCGPASFSLNASGGTNGQYFWYDQNGMISGQNNSTYATPVLSSTQVYYVSLTDGICVSAKKSITATINSIPASPTTTNVSRCGDGSLSLTASGTTNGNYLWYDQNGVINGENNDTYTTPVLSATTDYQVAATNGTCISAKTSVTATINTIPSAPTTTDTSVCAGNGATLNAAGGTDGQYRWYIASAGGAAISGEMNGSLTISSLNATTTYYVAINNGTCESNRSPVTITIKTSGCLPASDNLPPVIESADEKTIVEGDVILDLSSLISDPDNNLDLSTLEIVKQPISNATARIDENHNLIIDYGGIFFSGKDELTIQVCDEEGACTQQVIFIEVAGDVTVYNALSPNGDGKNDFLFLQYVDVMEDTKKNHVSIVNRWGDVVFDINNYDNADRVFKGLNKNGQELPTGTYFYKIQFNSSHPSMTGYLYLKR